MAKKVISLSIDEALLLEVDMKAKEKGLNRSEFIQETLEDYLRNRERWELIAENKLLKKEVQRLKELNAKLERIIAMNGYKEPEPIIINELEG